MSRREIREQIFKILFREEFYDSQERDDQLELALEELSESGADEKQYAYISEKVRSIAAHTEEIDALVNASAEKWKTTRMGKAELAIIRLAVYEMKYEEDIPVSVSINEAVELAKLYGDKQGAAFVNGVLAKLA